MTVCYINPPRLRCPALSSLSIVCCSTLLSNFLTMALYTPAKHACTIFYCTGVLCRRTLGHFRPVRPPLAPTLSHISLAHAFVNNIQISHPVCTSSVFNDLISLQHRSLPFFCYVLYRLYHASPLPYRQSAISFITHTY